MKGAPRHRGQHVGCSPPPSHDSVAFCLSGGNFTGQNQDLTPNGDMYDFPYRQYSAPQGRWISPDPAGLGAMDLTNPQSCNAYGYVGGSPLNSVDPLGLEDGDGSFSFSLHFSSGFSGPAKVAPNWLRSQRGMSPAK